ncbi:hypothetical protein L596_020004 [Steinernema carpocapsae]|uniref:Uncharacterized protein n=1 Tax=Steinernema carpocapsae TaxID=34508 RepID=A0A4U5MSA3_STECR|nr:hypothetical protein L596_020004 [Steinernema carpocapsae]
MVENHLKPPICVCCLPVTTVTVIIAILTFVGAVYNVLLLSHLGELEKFYKYRRLIHVILLANLAVCFISLLAIATIYKR